MVQTATPSKEEVAAHLADTADQALEDVANTIRKLADDAMKAGCQREFKLALTDRDIEGHVRHFLSWGTLKALGLD